VPDRHGAELFADLVVGKWWAVVSHGLPSFTIILGESCVIFYTFFILLITSSPSIAVAGTGTGSPYIQFQGGRHIPHRFLFGKRRIQTGRSDEQFSL
jgi:hypothetical protein